MDAAETAEVVAQHGTGPSAFDDLYRDEWAGLVGLAWSLTGSWALAEELAQDAFVDAFRRWGEVGGLDRPGAWVRRAVINRSASAARHASMLRACSMADAALSMACS